MCSERRRLDSGRCQAVGHDLTCMPEASTAAGKGTYALGSSLVDVAMLCSLAFLSSSVCGTGGVTCALSSGS